MKKIVVVVLLLLMAGASRAQDSGANAANLNEYVSVVITLANRDVPQDSLDKYGVLVQSRQGVIAYALVPANRYEALQQALFVSQVVPSTRVFLQNGQVFNNVQKTESEPPADTKADKENEGVVKSKRGYSKLPEDERLKARPTAPADGENGGDSLTIIENYNGEWYLGIMLGGSLNNLKIVNYPLSTISSTDNGLNLDIRAGYQFNRLFGLRTDFQVLSKNFNFNTTLPNTEYETDCNNMYVQVPLMADLSLGGNVLRVHLMGGVYGAYWSTQYRTGYIFSATNDCGTGWKRGFEPEFDHRWDAGLAAAVEVSLRINPEWQLHFGCDYYHSLTSVYKAPYEASNRTLTYQMGLTYRF